jgi:hypothetical protein
LNRPPAAGSFASVVTFDAIAPPYFIVAGLLVLSGVLKLARPRATAQAMADAGLPRSGDALARGLGLAEIGVAAWAFVAPAAGGAIVLAALYLAFAGFLAWVLRFHPDAGSCGCAGARSVPPSRLHLGLDMVAAATALSYAAVAGPGLRTWIGGLGPGAAWVLAGSALAGWLAVIAVTEAPGAWRAWTRLPDQPGHVDHRAEHRSAEDALAASGIGPGHPSLWPGVEEPA